jgi:hypothetical protein
MRHRLATLLLAVLIVSMVWTMPVQAQFIVPPPRVTVTSSVLTPLPPPVVGVPVVSTTTFVPVRPSVFVTPGISSTSLVVTETGAIAQPVVIGQPVFVTPPVGRVSVFTSRSVGFVPVRTRSVAFFY